MVEGDGAMYSLADLCAIIVYYNGGEQVVNHALELKKYISDVLIVDNGSRIPFSQMQGYNEEIAGIKIQRNNENVGIATALNQGLEFAKQNNKALLLTLDQDSVINRATVERLAAAINPNDNVISVGPYYGQSEKDNACTKEVSYLITSGNVVAVDTIAQIGGYSDRLFIDCVDIDLSFNILANGFRMQKISGTYLEHKIGEYERSKLLGIKYLSHSPKRFFYIYRNNIYIYKRYFRILPVQSIKLLMSLLGVTFKVLLLEQDKSAKLKESFKGVVRGFENNYENE